MKEAENAEDERPGENRGGTGKQFDFILDITGKNGEFK